MAKTYAGTYLYSQYAEYEKQIFSFLMNSIEIDKDSSEFEDIKYEVKRRNVSNSLYKLLEYPDIVLMSNEIPLPKAFKVFCAKDVKRPKENMKIFIDCSNIIRKDEKLGKYICRKEHIDIFISYLVSAMHTYIYYADEKRLTGNVELTKTGARAFATLLTYVVDYACKISTMPTQRAKCMYISAVYYISNLLGRDFASQSTIQVAKKIAGLSDREADVINIELSATSMQNINFFIQKMSEVLRIPKLTLDIIIERWMTVFGTGTVFALEMFPAFASMITDAYIGAYINNQKSIEKIIGYDMTGFTKDILSIGAGSV